VADVMLLIPCTFLQLIREPSYALGKLCSEVNIKLLHVSASGCHRQGIIQSKGLQVQQYLGVVSAFLK
jgi:hypothetical protein